VSLTVWLRVTPSGRAFGSGALLVGESLGVSDISLLRLLSDKPAVAELSLPIRSGSVIARLYSPATPGSHPALILVTGNAVDVADVQLNRLAESLARLDIAALITQLPGLHAGQLVVDDVRSLVEVFEWLSVQPNIDPKRVGFSGFCIGSSLAIVAAADKKISDQVVLVNAFGGYYDLTQLMRAIAVQSIRNGVDEIPWKPAEPSLVLFARNVFLYIEDPHDRMVISDEFAKGGSVSIPPAGLSEQGTFVYQLLTTSDPHQFDRLIEQLPSDLRNRLNALSPSQAIGHVLAPIYIMHDVSDPYVPVTESYHMAAAVNPTQLHYTQFAFFNHVRPDQSLAFWQVAWDGLRLAQHLGMIIQKLQS
jgi:dienelactone hydrolase